MFALWDTLFLDNPVLTRMLNAHPSGGFGAVCNKCVQPSLQIADCNTFWRQRRSERNENTKAGSSGHFRKDTNPVWTFDLNKQIKKTVFTLNGFHFHFHLYFISNSMNFHSEAIHKLVLKSNPLPRLRSKSSSTSTFTEDLCKYYLDHLSSVDRPR